MTVWLLVKADDPHTWYGVYATEEDALQAISDRFYYLRGRADTRQDMDSVDFYATSVREVTVGEDFFD